MKLTDTLSLLVRRWWLVLAVGLVVAIVALLVQGVRSETFVAETTVTVTRVNRAETTDFQYDNYYAVQATELVTNTAARFFEAGDFAQAVGVRADMDVSDDDALSFARNFKAKQSSPHLLRVQVRSEDKAEAEKLLEASLDELDARLAEVELAETSGDEATQPAFSATRAPMIAYARTYSRNVVLGAGFVAGLLVGLAVVVLEAALRTDAKRSKKR